MATNPGPAVNGIANSVLATIPVNSQTNSTPVLTDTFRLLGEAKGISSAGAGDTALPVFNSTRYVVTAVVVACSNGVGSTSAAYNSAASVGVFTATNSGGTILVNTTAFANISNTNGVNYATVVTATTTAWNTVANLYVHVGTTVASTTGGTFDVAVYGYDLS